MIIKLVPPHRKHECEACGRLYITGGSIEQYADSAMYPRGSKGYCNRDQYRIQSNGAPISTKRRSEETVEEAEALKDQGYSLPDIARVLGIQTESVIRAYQRAEARAAA